MDYFGFYHLKMLPPRKELYPVLGIRSGGKTLYALCRWENTPQKIDYTISGSELVLTRGIMTPATTLMRSEQLLESTSPQTSIMLWTMATRS